MGLGLQLSLIGYKVSYKTLITCNSRFRLRALLALGEHTCPGKGVVSEKVPPSWNALVLDGEPARTRVGTVSLAHEAY